jgi:hypothetical protein
LKIEKVKGNEKGKICVTELGLLRRCHPLGKYLPCEVWPIKEVALLSHQVAMEEAEWFFLFSSCVLFGMPVLSRISNAEASSTD